MKLRILLSIVFIAGCTAKNSPSLDNLPPTLNSPDNAEKLISDVQDNMNKDPQYALSSEDQSALSEEGIATESELKGWVK